MENSSIGCWYCSHGKSARQRRAGGRSQRRGVRPDGHYHRALAKESQNPVANIFRLPFENNLSFGVGPEDARVNTVNLEPVYPVQLGELNLINRLIVPLEYQEERFDGEGSQSGLGNIAYQAFLSPAKPGKIIWGLGPALSMPTNTDDRLGSDNGLPGRHLLRWPGRGTGTALLVFCGR